MTSAPAPAVTSAKPGAGLTAVLALSCGLTVANLYYAQPLLDAIARRFDVAEGTAAFVVTATQVGYVLGLLFVLPLGDLVETRRLVSRTLVLTALSAAVCAAAPSYGVFLIGSLILGITSVVAQVLIPYAAHLADDASRGRMIGMVMTGLLTGILLARSFSSVVAGAFGWRSIFAVSAVLMLGLAVALPRILVPREPEHRMSYARLLGSVVALVPELPALRRRALSQALMFGAFSAFWSAVAFELINDHGLDQFQIGLFALAGAGGAVAAPVAGRLGDRGHSTIGGGLLILLGIAAMAAAGLGRDRLWVLVLAGFAVDFAVQGHQVLSQREIYGLRADARSRINTVFMSSVFTGGAIASAGTGLLHDSGGWTAATWLGGGFAAAAFVIWGLAALRARSREVR
ncbi:MFS transporter [Spongisporangium articulatum]|uniref:MFS transporter n=1 Tax=Spongisporangium articulatum TaxID=3362603 RepID=A0ABW8APD5_9ACTN